MMKLYFYFINEGTQFEISHNGNYFVLMLTISSTRIVSHVQLRIKLTTLIIESA